MNKSILNAAIVDALKSYFKAFYPLIYILSHEEDRIEFYVRQICKELGLKLLLWDSIDGFVQLDEKGDAMKSKCDDMDDSDYLNSLRFIEAEGNEKSVFLLRDFHPAFSLDAADHIIRKIRNVIVSIRQDSKIIIMLMPPGAEAKAVPPELEKDVVLYRFPLPGVEESAALFDQVVNESLDGRVPDVLSEEERQTLVKASMGLTSSEMVNAFIRAGFSNGGFNGNCIKTILEEKKQIIDKTGILEYFSTDVESTEVGGLENLKKWLLDNRMMFNEQASKAGCDTPQGLLLFGVPGCGKSLTAKALASLWKMPLVRFDLGAVFGGLVGESERNMRRALDAAESVAPCVLWVDEIEKGLAGMLSAVSGDSGTSQRVFGSLVSWMQEKKAPVFFVATANDITRIADAAPELLRAGRFDEVFFIDLPGKEERKEIFAIHLKKRNEDPLAFDPDTLAELSSGFSGADIEQVVKDAKRTSFVQGTALNAAMMHNAIDDRLPVAVTMKDKIEQLRDWAAMHAKLASTQENRESIGSVKEFIQKRHSLRKIEPIDDPKEG